MRIARSLVFIGLLVGYVVVAHADIYTDDPVKNAANIGDPIALNQLCYGYLYGSPLYPKDFNSALTWCKKGAEFGDPNSETLYAEIYYLGDGVAKDITIAREWYRKAAVQGHKHAQYMMGRIESQADRPNLKAVCYWLLKSIAQDDKKAQTFYDQLKAQWSESYPDQPPFCTGFDIPTTDPP